MTWTLELAANAAASSWTDITALVDRTTMQIGGQAAAGEAGSYGFDFADDAAAYTLPARRVVRFKIGSTVAARGRIASKGLSRGSMPIDDARAFDVLIGDGNQHLQGIPIHRWSRPAETDVARVHALIDTFLSGSPRASTDLADTYVSAAATVSLPKKRYDTTNPLGVLQDIVRVSGKFAFITVDDEVFYAAPDSTIYAADISITDDAPDLVDEFPPVDPTGTEDGTEVFTGLRLVYGTKRSTVHDTVTGGAAAYDYWEEVVFSDARTTAEATSELAAKLDELGGEEGRYVFGVQLTAAQISRLKYGQTLSFRSAASGVLTPSTIRISQLQYEEVGDGIWLVHCEGGPPEKLAPRLTRGKPSEGEPFDGGQDMHYMFGTFTFASDGAGSSEGPGFGTTIYSDFNRTTALFSAGEEWTYAIGLIMDGSDYAQQFGLGVVNPGPPSGLVDGWGPLHLADPLIGSAGSFTVGPGIATWAVVAEAAAGGHVPHTVNVTAWFDPPGWEPPSPNPGQQVFNDVPDEVPDGVIVDFTTGHGGNWAYVPGTLRVKVNGIWRTDVVETDPDAGQYQFIYPPLADAEIVAEYEAA